MLVTLVVGPVVPNVAGGTAALMTGMLTCHSTIILTQTCKDAGRGTAQAAAIAPAAAAETLREGTTGGKEHVNATVKMTAPPAASHRLRYQTSTVT